MIIRDNSIVFEREKVKIKNNIKKDTSLVNIDKLRIREVLENLITNSMKFMDNKKELTFDAITDEKFLTIKIKDTGIGISKKHIKKIFEEFYKADPSRHAHSSGLGLSICKRIIKKHGGKIWAESWGIEKGSTFYFTLPIYNKRR